MPPSPWRPSLQTRLLPEESVERVTGLTLSTRNTYTGHHGFRKLKGPRIPQGISTRHASFRDVSRHILRRAAARAHEPYPKCDRNSNASFGFLAYVTRDGPALRPRTRAGSGSGRGGAPRPATPWPLDLL